MARVRKGAISPGSSGRRSATRRRVDTTPLLSASCSRENSPSKNVHFGSGPRLIQGPTNSDPSRRSQSPTRPALTRRGGSCSPSTQLQAEHDVTREHGKRRLEVSEGRGEQRAATGVVKAGVEHNHGSGVFEGSNKGAHAIGPATAEITEYLHHLRFQEDSTELNRVICETMVKIHLMVYELVIAFPPTPCNSGSLVEVLLQPENAQLIGYIGSVAQGGNSHIAGWDALLRDKFCREQLASGTIGRVLKEHVFDELFFGATTEFLKELSEMERQQVHQDGFFRTERRAQAIQRYLDQMSQNKGSTTADEKSLRSATARLTLQLEQLLLPLFLLGGGGTMSSWTKAGCRQMLSDIVHTAAQLSRLMRRTANVVFSWTVAFKDEEFDPARMDCNNLSEMISNSPYDKQTVHGIDRAILRAGQEGRSDAIVRIVCFPGLVSYQRGGGQLAREEIEGHVQAHRRRVTAKDEGLTGDEGFRTVVVCKSLVQLQWGRQRRLTKEAGTAVHVDAMQGRDGRSMKRYEEDCSGAVSLGEVFRKVLDGQTVGEQEEEHRRGRSPRWASRVLGL